MDYIIWERMIMLFCCYCRRRRRQLLKYWLLPPEFRWDCQLNADYFQHPLPTRLSSILQGVASLSFLDSVPTTEEVSDYLQTVYNRSS
jgi:hypothetical protein